MKAGDCMNYYEAYKDVWIFHKKYIDKVSDADGFWNAVTEDARALAKKYQECDFIKNLILNEVDEFERLVKASAI